MVSWPSKLLSQCLLYPCQYGRCSTRLDFRNLSREKRTQKSKVKPSCVRYINEKKKKFLYFRIFFVFIELAGCNKIQAGKSWNLFWDLLRCIPRTAKSSGNLAENIEYSGHPSEDAVRGTDVVCSINTQLLILITYLVSVTLGACCLSRQLNTFDHNYVECIVSLASQSVQP